jgi:hypothetical protein
VVGLASLSTSEALLVCIGGSVMVTSNSGKSWKKADELVGTMAVGAGVAATGWPALARVAMAFKPDPSPLQTRPIAARLGKLGKHPSNEPTECALEAVLA